MERTALINIPGLDLLSLLSPLSLHRRGGGEEANRSRTGGVKPCCRCADLIRKHFPPENFHLFGGSFLERRRKKKLFGRVVANNSGEGDRSKKRGGVNFPYLTNNPASIDLPAACKSTRKEGGETPSKSSHSSSAREREGRSSISTFDGAKEN